jgi:hypothetical protein
MANYDIPWWSISRLRYFDHQPLFDQDMIDEQAFHIGQRQRATRLLHAPGIAEGLRVQASKLVLQISPGTAFDVGGRPIVLVPSNDPSNPYAPTNEQMATYWTACTDPAGWWQHDFSNTPPPAPILLYVRFLESQEPGPGGSVGNTRWQQTPIIDFINADQGPSGLAAKNALLLAIVQVSGSSFDILYQQGTLARPCAGLSVPGLAAPATLSGAVPPVAFYGRSVPDGDRRVVSGAILELGGFDGVVLGLTSPTGTGDPMCGVVPMAPALSVGSDSNVAFGGQLTLSAVAAPSSGLVVGKTLLVATPTTGGAAQVTIGAPFSVSPSAGTAALHVTADAIELAAPQFNFGAVTGAALQTQAAAVLLRSALFAAGQPVLFTSADAQTPLGYLSALTAPGVSVGFGGAGGAVLALGNGSTVTPAVTVGATQLALAGQITLARGDLAVPGSITMNADLTIGDRVSSIWALRQIIDDTDQLDPVSGSMTVSFPSQGGALVITVTGTLILNAPRSTAINPTATLSWTLDGKPVATISATVQFQDVGQSTGQSWATIMVPLTRFVVENAPKQTAHALTVTVAPVPPLVDSGQPVPSTHLFASALELPVASFGGG